ncbi:MAG TPA: hypothetical protein PK402_12980 [Tepidisphaeraceae bacterium]|nr:hypothetical protein [Tepidisphaeraceae bacterium]
MNNANNTIENATGLCGYYPEMGEKRPADAVIDARLAHYGKHYFLKTPLVLAGRGIELLNTLKAHELTPAAQHKVGWHEYKVTVAAFEKLWATYKIASESML